MKNIRQILEDIPFSHGVIIDAVNLYQALKQRGVSFDDLSLFVKNKNIKNIKQIPCPLCKSPLLFYNITIEQGRKNKKGYKRLILCPNNNCLYEKFEK